MTAYTADQDPGEFTVDQVTDYLAAAPADEAAKVKALEDAGKARKGILEFSPSPEAVPTDDDGYTRVLVDAYRPGPAREVPDNQE